jgi:hypothetical protein
MDGILDLPGVEIIAAVGRAEVTLVRELTAADLHLLDTLPSVWQLPTIQQLTQRHHALARLLASGMSDIQAGEASGYTPMRVSQLKQDPSFIELVRHYQEQVDESFRDVAAEMAGFSLDLMSELRDRFEEDPKSFSIGTLMEIMKSFLDRTGHGPSTKVQQDVTVNYGSRLEAARKRAADAETLRKQEDGSYAA